MGVNWIFSPDLDRVDRALVHRWLSERSYWARGRTRAVQDAAMEASRNYGLYRVDEGAQVAYARVVTDGATFAWLCDVFVDESVRGQGAAKELVARVVEDLDAAGLPRIVLGTADAQGLYARFGFALPEDPRRFMVRTAIVGVPA